MKRKNIFYFIVAAACLSLVSCDMDMTPKGFSEEEDLFSREVGFKEALTGAYQLAAKPGLYGGKLTYDYMDKLAQRYQYYDNSGRAPFQDPAYYEFDSEASEGRINPIWNDMYYIIANLNNLLHYVDRNSGVLVTPGYYEIIKGEALALRSYLYLDLLRMFGPVYGKRPEAASIVYRTALNRDHRELERADKMLGYIIADLKEADELLDGTDPLNFDYIDKLGAGLDEDPFLIFRFKRMNGLAVKALLARAYLYGGDKANAARQAEQVVKSGKFQLTRDNAFDHILSSEIIFGLHFDRMQTGITDRLTNVSEFVIDNKNSFFERLFNVGADGTNDIRVRPGNGFNETFSAGTTIYVMQKFDQTGLQYSMAETMPMIRLAEMYYILAECAATSAESARWLNEVRDARGILPLDAADFDDADLKTQHIGVEYRKEFYGEGQLWYYYKRTAATADRFFNMKNIMTELGDRHYIFNVPDDEYLFGGLEKPAN